jgi:hypothetical protein
MPPGPRLKAEVRCDAVGAARTQHLSPSCESAMASRFFDDRLFQILSQLAFSSPLLLVYAAGMYLAFNSLEKHRKSAVLVLAGSSLLLAATMIFPMITQAIIQNVQEVEPNGAMIRSVIAAISLVHSLVFAVGTGLLITAALVDRKYEAGPPD